MHVANMDCLTPARDRTNFETAAVLLLLLFLGSALAQCPSQCDCEGTAVYCSSKGLTSIPSGISEATTYLDLKSNQIGSIRDGLFSELKLGSLTSLLLDNNQLTEISSGTFNGLPELRTLQLNGNQISVIDDRAFAGLSHLTSLQLNSNRLVKIGRDNLAGLSQLQSLHVCCMSTLTSVDDSAFSHVENLRNLYLSSTGLQEPPLDFRLSFLSDLVHLDLRYSRIRSLTFGALSGLSSLPSLSLDQNQISSVADGAFTGLSSLTYLSLERVQLSSLSAGAFTGLTSLRTLNMPYNQLTVILPNTFRDLTSLTSLVMRSNQISTVSDGSFAGLTSLQSLSLYSNRLTAFPSGMFSAMTRLTSLDMCYNSLSSIPSNTFEVLIELSSLDLERNQISTINGNSFSGLTNLQTLDLQYNLLTEIPSNSFGDLASLTSLYLTGNTISTIYNDSFIGLAGLQRLQLNSNSLKLFPPLQPMNASLQYLYLSDNFIADIMTVSFSSFPSLVYLDVSNNNFTSFSIDNFGTAPLRQLYVSRNKLASLPPSLLKNLTLLERFGATDNLLTSLENGTFTDLPNLQYLYLQNNLLSEIDSASLSNLTSLKQIYLQNNRISRLDSGALKASTHLQLIYLYNNQLTELESGTFAGFSSLQYLELNSNMLTSLHENIFAGLSALTRLRLDHNELNSLPLALFQDTTNLQTLYLQNNHLSGLPQGIFAGLVPSSIYAYYNPFYCSCNMLWFFNYLRDNSLRNEHLYGCSLSSDFVSVPFQSLHADNFTCVLPTFTIRPNDVIVSETKSIILPCSADGFPLPTITWFKAGILVTWHTQLESGALSIDSVDVTDEGQYECVAINTAEIEIRTSMVLTVQALCTEGKCVIFEATYRDFKMDSVYSPSFSSSAPLSGIVPDIVDKSLGPQNVPALRDRNVSVYSDFSNWFIDFEGINSRLNSSLRLDRDNDIYVFQSESFFPVDKNGFVNNTIDLKDCSEENHNFGFTSRFLSAFRYEGNETLVVHGNDDIWVFVDKTMVVDLSGTHKPLCQEVILPGAGLIVKRTGSGIIDSSVPACVGEVTEWLSPLTLQRELEVGRFYRLDIFHAQRHSCINRCPNCSSTFHIATTIQAANFANQVLILVVDEGINITDPIGVITINEYNVLFEGVVNFTFTIMEGNDAGRFVVNSSSGEIQLMTTLDYEETTDYMLVVKVSNAQDPSKTAVVAVSVEVVDINDNTPSVIPLYAEVEVHDMAEGGLPIVTFVAEDADSGNNGELVMSVMDVTSVNRGMAKIEFTVTVSVADKGVPPNIVNSTIIVRGPVVCSGSSFVVDQSTLQLKIVSAKYYIDSVNGICLPCEAGYYCNGDGLRHKCGCARNDSDCQTIPSEYSNGLALKCSPCPEGWICSDGRAEPCEDGFYADPCNSQECQEKCLPCPAGNACMAGKRTPCRAGTYEQGNVRCLPCPRDSYSNGTSNTRCQCCPAGFRSSYSKDGCQPCRENEWSTGSYDDSQCSGCHTCTPSANCTCRHRPCFPGVHCVNLVGQTPSFSCLSCPLGYEGNGINCSDINECSHATPCSEMTRCINTSPGYMCTACPPGYTGHVPHGVGLEHATQMKQVCDDVNECEINNGGCDIRSTCINEQGTYSCSACEPGYIGNGYTGCLLGDLCELGTHSCHKNAVCTTTGLGEFECKCMHGFTGNGFYCGKDSDLDGFPDSRLFCIDQFCFKDNCPDKPNSGQENEDGDGFGDACDDDIDNDGWVNYKDNCPYVYNTDQSDFDGDGVGNVCDNCWNYTNPLRADNNTRNPMQLDTDRDGVGDMCEHDRDGDGVSDDIDKCEFVYNPDQNDVDNDGVGDVCDNCILSYNPPSANSEQADTDRDFVGNECDNNVDSDRDGVQDSLDNCVSDANSDQLDTDGDGIGDVCDPDTDNDGTDDVIDNCPVIPNGNQTDLEGDGRGDACQNDFDGDGVIDAEDNCPVNPLISQTNFTSYLNISVDFRPSTAPEWIITDQGAEVTQKKSSNAAFLLSKEGFQAFDFSGTIFVDTNNDDDLIGIVFGYQDVGHFYLVSWKGRTEDYFRYACGTAKATGLSIKSSEPLFTSSVSWKHRTAYTFHVTHRPSVGLIQVVIEDENGTVADTGQLFDFSYAGGRIGLFCFSQENVIWSNLKYSCAERINHALEFDGIDDSVDLPEATRLSLDRSFTFDVWIQLPKNCCESILPVVCTRDGALCLYIENNFVHGVLSGKQVSSWEPLVGGEWNHIGLRFEAAEAVLSLILNGTIVATAENVQTYQGTKRIYLARNNKLQFFKGHVEELRFWSLALSDSDIVRYHITSSLSGAQTREQLQAHFDMNTGSGPTLYDQSRNGLNGLLYGGPKWVGSSLNFAALDNHNLKRRKRDLANQLDNGNGKDEL